MGNKKKNTQPDASEWEVMKSGVFKHKEENWYAGQYLNGWYFYTYSFTNNLGPYVTFELGVKDWKAKCGIK